jgi:hypothetical protein
VEQSYRADQAPVEALPVGKPVRKARKSRNAVPAGAFSAADKTRITKRTVELLRDGGSVGAVERLAGIEGEKARRDLWMPLIPIDKKHGTQAYFDAGMAECRRIIANECTEWVAL